MASVANDPSRNAGAPDEPVHGGETDLSLAFLHNYGKPMRSIQILTLICFSVLSSSVFGQIELSYTIRKTIVGATNAELLPGGRILIDDDSKISGSVVAEVRATSKNAYKFEAQKSLTEYATLIALPDIVKDEVTTKRFLLIGEGLYVFKATSRSDDLDRSMEVLIGKPKPTPTPEPDPPKPPDPTPDEAPPIALPGLRVLIVYEQDDVNKYSAATQAILYGASMRAYLESICVKNVAGMPEYRVFDKDVVAEQGTWKTALTRPRKSVPWIIISNGKKGFEGPLPESESETKTLIARFAK